MTVGRRLAAEQGAEAIFDPIINLLDNTSPVVVSSFLVTLIVRDLWGHDA